VSPDGHFLAQPDGSPFFWLGDSALQLFKHLNHEEADLYLQDRAQKGFTVIQAVALGFNQSKNRDGEVPLVDNDPTRPNERYFANVDWVIDRARHYGLRIAMLPAWGDKVTGGWAADPQIFTPANARVYGRWLASRYREKGILWVLGGDTNPLWPERSLANQFGTTNEGVEGRNSPTVIVDYRPIYDALALGLTEGDGGHPFITYHPTNSSFSGTADPRTSLYLGDRTWLDMNMLQTGHFADPVHQVFPQIIGLIFSWKGTTNYEPVNAEYHSTPTRPIIDGETRWEDLPINQLKGNAYWTAYDTRNGAYHAVFAGAAGHNYGNENVANFFNPAVKPAEEMEWKPWMDALQSPVSGQLHFLKDLMLSRPYFTRMPDQSLIAGDQGQGVEHLSATRDDTGQYAMIYLPHGGDITINLAKLSGSRVRAWWFNPRTGAAATVERTFSTRRARAFTSPTQGSEDDWVLVVDSIDSHFPPPGREP
jgi:hypothetical protein